MLSSLITKKIQGEKKESIDPNELLKKEEKEENGNKNKFIFIGLGIILVGGLGVGLYYAFKK